jgi:hypothetical protein
MNRNEEAARRKRARSERQSLAKGAPTAHLSTALPRDPADAEKTIVVDEVRRVVSEELAGHGINHLGGTCVFLNGVAYGVLAALDPSNRMAWRLRAGGASCRTGTEDDQGPLCAGYDFAASLADGGTGEFHVWVVGGDGPATHAVDLTLEDFERIANQLGLGWNRTLPKYLWGDASRIEACGLWYASHAVATEQVERILLLETEWFARATRRAIDACAARGITRLF